MAKTYKSTRKNYTISDPPASEVAESVHAVFTTSLNPLNFIASILGLPQSVQSDMQYIQASRKGIKKSALDNLSHKMGITQEKMSQLLHISTRTYQRIKEEDALDIFTSEQAIEMALVLEKAQQVFETDSQVKQWLHNPSLAFGNIPPIDLLDTRFGVKMLMNTLGRIEHGIYA